MAKQLVIQLQSKLDLPGRGVRRDRVHDTEIASGDAAAGVAESWSIGEIKELRTELQPESFIQLEILQDGKIPGKQTVRPGARQVPRSVTERKRLKRRESVPIEPTVNSGVGQRRITYNIRPVATECRRRCGDGDHIAALRGQNAVCHPPADDLFDKPRTAFAEGEFITE